MSTLIDSDYEQLRRLEESLWQAETRFDDIWMNEVLADDFFEYGRSGRIYSRDDSLAVPAQEIRIVLPLSSFEVRLIHPDIAQVTYISDVEYRTGRELANRSSIWSRTADGWELRFHQGTPFSRE